MALKTVAELLEEHPEWLPVKTKADTTAAPRSALGRNDETVPYHTGCGVDVWDEWQQYERLTS